jgi:hypothetical protein
MKVIVTFILFFGGFTLHAQATAEFHWLDLEQPSKAMNTVRAALKSIPKTAIREVGIKGSYALVIIANRESPGLTPNDDEWKVLNVSLVTGKADPILSGYMAEYYHWIGAYEDELAFSYLDCTECEPVRIFTTLHYKPHIGWSARWSDPADKKHLSPGVLMVDEVCEGCTDDELTDEVFAILTKPNGNKIVGHWSRHKNVSTGKITDYVVRNTYDSKTGAETTTELHDNDAIALEKVLCSGKDMVPQPSFGQNSKACRDLMKTNVNSGQK